MFIYPVIILLATQFIGYQASTNDVLDPKKEACQYFSGEYSREYKLGIVCCGNDTLDLPKEFTHNNNKSSKALLECSAKFKEDPLSDLPTAVWNDVLCEMKKLSLIGNVTLNFKAAFEYMTNSYPEKIKSKLRKLTNKCSEIDSKKLRDDVKLEKYLGCFYAAEQKICHKPYGQVDNREDQIKKAKEYGCPVMPGLVSESPTEYCCKNRSIPYPILFFPIQVWTSLQTETGDFEKVDQCKESFSKREEELMSSTVNTLDKSNEGLSWDKLCTTTCLMFKRNYTKAIMKKLDFDFAMNFITSDYGKMVRNDIIAILKRRKDTKRMFRSMDGPKTRPMTYKELTDKYSKASEKERIPYFCKFVETVLFEERRALHEYCINEKFADEWGEDHHSLFFYAR